MKVGDEVKIIKRGQNDWHTEMDACIGKWGIVEENNISNINPLKISFESNIYWYFSYESVATKKELMERKKKLLKKLSILMGKLSGVPLKVVNDIYIRLYNDKELNGLSHDEIKILNEIISKTT